MKRTPLRRENGERVPVAERAETTVTHSPGTVMRQVEETREHELPDAFNLGRDRVHWGPIVAGLLTALTTLLLLSLSESQSGLRPSTRARPLLKVRRHPTRAGTRPSGPRSPASWRSCSAAMSPAAPRRSSTGAGAH